LDTLTSVVVANEHIYGVAAITTTLVEKARGLHGASPTAAAALGRLLTGGVLLGSLLKDTAHRVTLQVSSKGPVRSILVEADGAGQVRGYLGRPAINVPSRNGKLDVSAAVGKGILNVIRETGAAEPYSGTVPLVSGEIAEDLASYFVQSEQIPSAVSLGVFVTPDHSVAAAGGFLVQFHADIDDDLILHVEQALGAMPTVTTLVQEGYGPQDILRRALGGLDLEVVRRVTPIWHCACSRDRVVGALLALGPHQLQELINEQPETQVRCEFCATEYSFSQHELSQVLADALE
jgi:molecular chaperone Hsp33